MLPLIRLCAEYIAFALSAQLPQGYQESSKSLTAASGRGLEAPDVRETITDDSGANAKY